jgi:hypothetical protein
MTVATPSGALRLAAIEASGLGEVLRARLRGESIAERHEALASADILVLGALADWVRAHEVGDEVRVTMRRDAHVEGARLVRAPDVAPDRRGLAFLRAVALARLESAPGAQIAVDWGDCGFELAQLALSFGANALSGPPLSRRGLPIADDQAKKVKGQGMVSVATLKHQELCDLVRRIGRTPVSEAVT